MKLKHPSEDNANKHQRHKMSITAKPQLRHHSFCSFYLDHHDKRKSKFAKYKINIIIVLLSKIKGSWTLCPQDTQQISVLLQLSVSCVRVCEVWEYLVHLLFDCDLLIVKEITSNEEINK
ncbi:hypothetical protein EK904_007506 [Melospiza melodia maxima]|nr:hypothetical protein EK904_007506 [Melospiza melodia maxima]